MAPQTTHARVATAGRPYKPSAAGYVARRATHPVTKEPLSMAYSVPDLPYDYAALEPHIDEATMKVHHDKHHQAYADKVNAALEGTDFDGKPIEEVLKNLDALPADKQN